MEEHGYRAATQEENEAARIDLVRGNAAARLAAEGRGILPNPRIVAARLR